jgi:hypothetical protein
MSVASRLVVDHVPPTLLNIAPKSSLGAVDSGGVDCLTEYHLLSNRENQVFCLGAGVGGKEGRLRPAFQNVIGIFLIVVSECSEFRSSGLRRSCLVPSGSDEYRCTVSTVARSYR